ncbi:MAG: ABC transporter permease [Candidatus Omnitrophica bacterium]|nr:ABC transporter permease [Candidatus Omnitrophota bacterium]
MRRGPLYYLSGLFLAGIVLGACFANRIAPYDPNREDRQNSFHPPTRIHFWDENGRFHARPFVRRMEVTYDRNLKRCYEEVPGEKYFLRRGRTALLSVQLPARIYLFGADSRGRDLFSRVLYGARTSLSLGLFGALVATAVGFLLGAVAGYCGGWRDTLLMRFSEFFIMIPAFYLLLALRSVLPPTLGPSQVYGLVILILSLVGWGGVARVVRGMVLSLREREFVLAARMLGRGTWEILGQHILPHTLSYLAVILSVSIPAYILGESFLSVLGLGIQEPAISWGNLLAEALSVARVQLHPWVLFPGLFIFLVALACNVLGDHFRDRTAYRSIGITP